VTDAELETIEKACGEATLEGDCQCPERGYFWVRHEPGCVQARRTAAQDEIDENAFEWVPALVAEVRRLRAESLKWQGEWFALSKREERWENVREDTLEEAAKAVEAIPGQDEGPYFTLAAAAIRDLKEKP